MQKRIKKILFSSLIPAAALIPISVSVISCTDKNLVEFKNTNKEIKKQTENIKAEINKLTWDDFYLSKNSNGQKINYKNFTYEEFFEYQGSSNEKKLHSLKEIETNKDTSKLGISKSLDIDKEKTIDNYVANKDLIKNISEFNKDKKDEEKLIVIFRSVKLAAPENAILVFLWLTQKKYLEKNKEVKDIKYLAKKQINLYGHWFRNEEAETIKKQNHIWKIVSYVVPAIAIGGLALYIIIALIIRKKKTAFKNKKGDKK
ncbi:Hypothetical protein, predicted transmembrane protein [Metamycoplasma auris 15026]|uniref:Lipoprotein n=1 Tax=Metamycoplasma auris 15026 TaxID=1188233 RepID=N9VAN2_9BACT|nr:hypothetical protein [Metamycoplasma auris]ENY68713.1 Hypothetical protein, predicted transmembrane protein [Metamycoplasma auris 15026]